MKCSLAQVKVKALVHIYRLEPSLTDPPPQSCLNVTVIICGRPSAEIWPALCLSDIEFRIMTVVCNS